MLQPTDAAEDNFFGSDIALVDGVLYVGAPGRVNGGTSGTGAVYAFDAVTLAELNTYIASNTAPTPEPSFFGTSIAVEGTNLLVGSSEPDPSDPDKAGAAYLIDLAAGAQVHRFTQTMGDFGTRTRDFGDEVALAGNLAIVADPNADRNPTGAGISGTVNFYDITTGQQVERLLASFQAYGAGFGRVIEVRDNEVYIGARAAGGMRVYDAQDRSVITTLVPPIPPQGFAREIARFGSTLATGNSTFSPGELFETDIFLYNLDTEQVVQIIDIDPDPGTLGLGQTLAINDRYLLATRSRVPEMVFGNNVVVFDPQTGDLLGEIEPPVGFERGFGLRMALNGDTAYVYAEANPAFPRAGSAVLVYDLTRLGDCAADINGDGELTPADFNAWVLAFNAQAPECDQNGDSVCDPS
ncbi:MAG: hypothetical protein AAFY46_03755, partial [Planctomycetota bacterium]